MGAMSAPLPPAPASVVDAAGAPVLGAHLGHVPGIRWDGLRGAHARGPLWRALHAKRWHYVSIAGERAVVALAVVDLGWAASAFAYVFDRAARALRIDLSWTGVTGISASVARTAGEGARTSFRAPGARLRLERAAGSGRWRVEARAGSRLRLEATLDAAAAPPTLCAIAGIPGGVANCTHKTTALPATGEVVVDGVPLPLDGAVAALDHTSGLLARDTRWRWASAAGRGIGLNLVEGFNGPVENAVWLDGRVHPVGAAEIRFDANDPSAPWVVRTLDGRVDLVFTPEGERREDKDLVLAASRYVQPIGTYRGTIRPTDGAPAVEVRDLVGVAEDHAARW
jgi:hypothetical protein